MKYLRNPNNPIVLGKKKDFKSYDIDIEFEDEALYDLAAKAYEEKTGARGLVSAVEKVLLKFEKKLPSTDIHETGCDAGRGRESGHGIGETPQGAWRSGDAGQI